MSQSSLFRVVFFNQGKIYEIFARSVYQGELHGFVTVEDLVFETSSLLVDPAEERLRDEFNGVRRCFVPMHAVVRIDEVEKRGTAKIRDVNADDAKVMPFPGLTGAPGNRRGNS